MTAGWMFPGLLHNAPVKTWTQNHAPHLWPLWKLNYFLNLLSCFFVCWFFSSIVTHLQQTCLTLMYLTLIIHFFSNDIQTNKTKVSLHLICLYFYIIEFILTLSEVASYTCYSITNGHSDKNTQDQRPHVHSY